MTDKPTIKERENGPLVVKGIKTMIGPDGEAIEVKEVMALCRCGASKNKPFCDGSHNRIGFDSSRKDTSARDKVYTYSDGDVTVHYSKLLCSHAGKCAGQSRAMFDPDRKPWIMPEKGTKTELTEIVQACPSGALRLSVGADDPAHLYDEGAEITVERNGSYWIRDVELENPKDMQGATPRKYTLCRCGLSGNKPYCDGTHYEEGWNDDQT